MIIRMMNFLGDNSLFEKYIMKFGGSLSTHRYKIMWVDYKTIGYWVLLHIRIEIMEIRIRLKITCSLGLS